MLSDNVVLIIAWLFFIAASTSVVAFILLLATLDRRLMKSFKENPEITPQGWFLRVMGCSLCVLIKNRSQENKYMMFHYKGFNFYSFAKPYERLLCLAFNIATMTFISIGFFTYFLDIIGYIDMG